MRGVLHESYAHECLKSSFSLPQADHGRREPSPITRPGLKASRSASMNVNATAHTQRAAWLALQHQLSAVGSRILLADADASRSASAHRVLYTPSAGQRCTRRRAFRIWGNVCSHHVISRSASDLPPSVLQRTLLLLGIRLSCEFGRRKFPENFGRRLETRKTKRGRPPDCRPNFFEISVELARARARPNF